MRFPRRGLASLAFRPQLLPANRPAIAIYLLCLVAAVAGTIDWWPSLPTGWIDLEEEREGLGLIIATLSLIVAGWTWWRRERSGHGGRAVAP